jgi:hypothetical protein
MRSAVALWPATLREWLPGFALSLPIAAALWLSRSAPEDLRNMLAGAAVLLAIPWIVPATMLLGALSSPVYMWLHTQGPVPGVLQWLGGVVLIAAVLGCHVNGALIAAWWRGRQRGAPEPGLAEFLKRSARPK